MLAIAFKNNGKLWRGENYANFSERKANQPATKAKLSGITGGF